MGPNASCRLESGGTIGRLKKADWVLPDPDRFVSGVHVRIIERGAQHFVVDLSSNGTQLNGRQLTKGQETPLTDGDTIGIGDYKVLVSKEGDQPDSVPPSPSPLPIDPPVSSGISVDPLDLILDNTPQPSAPQVGAQPDNAPIGDAFFEPPSQTHEPSETSGGVDIPDRWWEEGAGSAFADTQAIETQNIPSESVPKKPAPQTQQPAPVVNGGDLDAMLTRAGLDPSSVSPENRAAMGDILRVVAQGLVDLLRSRAEFKNQLRVERTTLQSKENNPLKLSGSAEDALFQLFSRPVPGYMDAVSSFEEGFDDIKAHQLAMTAGMRAGFRAMLEFFSPERLAEDFDRGLKRAPILDVINKTKYWELFCEIYAELGDEDEAFRELYSEPFAQAYETQMQRLKRRRS